MKHIASSFNCNNSEARQSPLCPSMNLSVPLLLLVRSSSDSNETSPRIPPQSSHFLFQLPSSKETQTVPNPVNWLPSHIITAMHCSTNFTNSCYPPVPSPVLFSHAHEARVPPTLKPTHVYLEIQEAESTTSQFRQSIHQSINQSITYTALPSSPENNLQLLPHPRCALSHFHIISRFRHHLPGL